MQKYQDVVLNQNGNPVSGVQVTVTDLAGSPVAVYSSNAIGLNVNPLTSDNNGRFSFYAPDGRYSLTFTFGGNVVASISDILLEDPMDGSDAVFNDVTMLGSLSDASKITSAAVGGISATNVQDALSELDSDKASNADLSLKVNSADLAAHGGSALVGFVQDGAGAESRDLQGKGREIVSILDFIPKSEHSAVYARASTYDAADALENAWEATPEGGTLLILGRVRVGRAVVLSDRQVNIDCQGEIEIADGTFTGITFDGAPDLVEAGTTLSAITQGSNVLAYAAPPAINPEEYYLAIESTEDLITRIGNAAYTPYKKIENHKFSSHKFELFDDVLYSYTSLSSITLKYKRMSGRTTFTNLTVLAASSAASSARILVEMKWKSGITLDNFRIDARPSTRPGFGLRLDSCCDIIFNNPVVNGLNTSLGDSYKIVNNNSSHLTFNYPICPSEDDPAGSKDARFYSARHGNQIVFNGLLTKSADEHFGSNYTFNDCVFTDGGITFAGRNLTVRGGKVLGGYLMRIRPDTPRCDGFLSINGTNLSASSGIAYFIPQGSDPSGRTTEFKTFDDIEVKSITIERGVQSIAQRFYIFATGSAFTTFPTSSVQFIDVNDFSTVGSIGGALVNIQGEKITDLIFERCKRFDDSVTYYGDVRFSSAPSVSRLTMTGCRNINPYNVTNIEYVDLDGCVTSASGDMLIGAYTSVTGKISLRNSTIGKITAAASGAGTRLVSIVGNTFMSALPSNLAADVILGKDNTVAAGVSVSTAWRQKLFDYASVTYSIAGALSAEATYDPPSIAAGATASTTISVPGALVGDFALASFGASTATIDITAKVSADNTVTVYFRNVSAGAVDLNSNTLRARVWKY